jgi:hypothetical protein
MRIVATVALLIVTSAVSVWAAPQGTLAQQVQIAYPTTVMDKGGNRVAQKGSILAVQIDGILANPRRGLAPPPYYNEYTNGQIGPDTGLIAKALNEQAVNARALAIGEKVYLVKVGVAANAITFVIQTCGACDPDSVDIGHLPHKADVQFKFLKGTLAHADMNQVKKIIEQVFTFADAAPPTELVQQQPPVTQQAAPVEQQKFADIPPPSPPPTPARKLAKGMTTEQVRASFGEPESVIDLGSKVIYKYKDLKVTFLDGKLSDVE